MYLKVWIKKIYYIFLKKSNWDFKIECSFELFLTCKRDTNKIPFPRLPFHLQHKQKNLHHKIGSVFRYISICVCLFIILE